MSVFNIFYLPGEESLIVCFLLKENSLSEDELVLKMKAKLQGGVPFVWEFHCSEGGKHMVRKYRNEKEIIDTWCCCV